MEGAEREKDRCGKRREETKEMMERGGKRIERREGELI